MVLMTSQSSWWSNSKLIFTALPMPPPTAFTTTLYIRHNLLGLSFDSYSVNVGQIVAAALQIDLHISRNHQGIGAHHLQRKPAAPSTYSSLPNRRGQLSRQQQSESGDIASSAELNQSYRIV